MDPADDAERNDAEPPDTGPELVGPGPDASRTTDPPPLVTPGIDRHAPNPRRALPFLIVPIVIMIVMTNLGHAFFPTLVSGSPGLLLLLNSQNRYLALTTNNLEPLAYYGIASFRLLLPDPFFFLLGWWYGDRAITWIETRSATYGSGIRQLERAFSRAGAALVLTIPNNPVCLLAGAARMSPLLFAALNVVGTFGRLFIIRWLGDIFSGPIETLTNWIGQYRIPLTVVSMSIVAIIMIRDYRSGSGQIEEILELEDEIEEDYGSAHPGEEEP